jgi:hypothetical protein
MMYISVCVYFLPEFLTGSLTWAENTDPIAMRSAHFGPLRKRVTSMFSVRSTNVYEEQSLGVFLAEEESLDEDDFEPAGPRVTVWSRYLAMHARKQLAFGQ